MIQELMWQYVFFNLHEHVFAKKHKTPLTWLSINVAFHVSRTGKPILWCG